METPTPVVPPPAKAADNAMIVAVITREPSAVRVTGPAASTTESSRCAFAVEVTELSATAPAPLRATPVVPAKPAARDAPTLTA